MTALRRVGGPIDAESRAESRKIRPVSDQPWEDDEKLFALLAEQGFQGDLYWTFERHVGAYALGILQGWMASGRIFAELRRIGRTPPHTAAHDQRLRQSSHDREELASSAVSAALMHFCKTKGAGWSPEGGASLKTYFLRSALWRFRDPFVTWSGQESHRAIPWEPDAANRAADRGDPATWSHRDTDRRDQNPEAAYLDKETREELLRDGNPQDDPIVGEILALRERGLKNVEIERELGIKAGAVSKLIERNRRGRRRDG